MYGPVPRIDRRRAYGRGFRPGPAMATKADYFTEPFYTYDFGRDSQGGWSPHFGVYVEQGFPLHGKMTHRWYDAATGVPVEWDPAIQDRNTWGWRPGEAPEWMNTPDVWKRFGLNPKAYGKDKAETFWGPAGTYWGEVPKVSPKQQDYWYHIGEEDLSRRVKGSPLAAGGPFENWSWVDWTRLDPALTAWGLTDKSFFPGYPEKYTGDPKVRQQSAGGNPGYAVPPPPPTHRRRGYNPPLGVVSGGRRPNLGDGGGGTGGIGRVIGKKSWHPAYAAAAHQQQAEAHAAAARAHHAAAVKAAWAAEAPRGWRGW